MDFGVWSEYDESLHDLFDQILRGRSTGCHADTSDPPQPGGVDLIGSLYEMGGDSALASEFHQTVAVG